MFITIAFILCITGNLSIIYIICNLIPIIVYIYIYLAECCFNIWIIFFKRNITTSFGTGNRLKMIQYMIRTTIGCPFT